MRTLAALQASFMAEIFAEAPPRSPGAAVYRRNAFASLEGALAATYPVVRRLVGEAFFGEAARRHAFAQPSASGDLHEFGHDFASFLEGYALARPLAYLADVARLEWAIHECFHAAEAGTFDFAALGGVDPARHGEIRFLLDPAVRLVRSAHPVAAIWEANQQGGDGSIASAGCDRVLVRREAGRVRVERLADREWDFLHALALGSALAPASAAFEAGDAASLPGALARHVEAGVIAAFSLAPAGA